MRFGRPGMTFCFRTRRRSTHDSTSWLPAATSVVVGYGISLWAQVAFWSAVTFTNRPASIASEIWSC